MIRPTLAVDGSISLLALTLAAGLAGCSAANTTPGDGSGSAPGAGAGPAMPGAGGGGVVVPGGGGGPVGPVPGSGGGSNPGGGGVPNGGNGGSPPVVGAGGVITGMGGTPVGTGGNTSAGGSGQNTGGAAGNSGVGCGQGTFCMPGDDLAPPDPADGFQIVSPSTISMNPGAEQFLCYYKTVPQAADVGSFRSWMTKGASHHFIVFQGSGGVDGSLQSCAFGSGAWIYATSKSGLLVGMDMPPQVGLPFAAGTSLVMNMHLVNTGSAVVKPVVKLNVLYAKDVKYKAAAAYSALSPNLKINVPAHGMQTVNGQCSVPAGSKFFLWTTHTHKYATNVDINYVSGGVTTNIVKTTDWENPGTHTWGPTDFLTTKAGDTFPFACTYQNPNSFAVTFGETAASNEMCMAIGYFFPAGAFNCN